MRRPFAELNPGSVQEQEQQAAVRMRRNMQHLAIYLFTERFEGEIEEVEVEELDDEEMEDDQEEENEDEWEDVHDTSDAAEVSDTDDDEPQPVEQRD